MAHDDRHPLCYVLHSGNLYGTERMALETLAGLSDEFVPILLAPPGPAIDEARTRGFEVAPFRGAKQFAAALRPILRAHPRLTFIATSITQSAICIGLNLIYRREIKHIQIVQGGGAGKSGYGRKKWLNHLGVSFITVSNWAKDQLIQSGTRADRIVVIPNFLSPARMADPRRRPGFSESGVRNVLIVSRMDPIKRVDLLLDALDSQPAELAGLSFRVLGLGPDMKPLAERAKLKNTNVVFAGFCDDVTAELVSADLLLHTCPVESFGLAVLEAMAANLPVLVPDSGGAGLLVEEGISGFKFRADDPADLARRLMELKTVAAGKLNHAVAGARVNVDQTYTAAKIIEQYRRALRMA